MGNAKTAHSKALRAKTARQAYDKNMASGKKKQLNFNVSAEVIDAFIKHLESTGETTREAQLNAINERLSKISCR